VNGILPSYKVEVKLPKYELVSTSYIRRAVQEVNRRYAEKAQAGYRRTTRTWRQSPVFRITEAEMTGPGQSFEILAKVAPEGPFKDKYAYIDLGTRVRYAVMTPDFRPKTQPDWLGSRAGRGGFSHMDMQGRPGIKARNFSATIADRFFKPYIHSVRAAVQRSLRWKQLPPLSAHGSGRLTISAPLRRF
jgi:hypothetical protein